MQNEDRDGKRRTKKVDYKRSESQQQREKRVPATKSPYKIYEQPKRSNFSVCLDNIKHERDSIVLTNQSKQRHAPQSRSDDQLPGTSGGMVSCVHNDSSVGLMRKRAVNVRDAYNEYLRRKTTAPRRIRIIKIYIPLNWEEALEQSINKFVPVASIVNSWQQPRLQWLEKLEQDNGTPTRRSPTEENVNSPPCCLLCLYPFWPRRTNE
ncbi:uncharacterized protein LOC131683671 [Topomyia yanbarensis]|uniref:uncharacterized protein LOC131683671 n=1 Tax=Topomyia yanbarensis TaxID=2498891 RepID=UPI00273B7F6B|nr:uncharacterized protein LOC131683671 [Topomyia yanbarensis]